MTTEATQMQCDSGMQSIWDTTAWLTQAIWESVCGPGDLLININIAINFIVNTLCVTPQII